jgi:hypothetical protein
MKQRIYVDTSVFGGYFDSEFAEFTFPLFERIKNGELQAMKIVCILHWLLSIKLII